MGDEETTYVCGSCLDEHPIRDANGVILSRERLAGMSYVLPPGGGVSG